MATKKDKKAETQAILDYFAELPDPRRDNENKRHELIDIIAIAILATICGAEHFSEMEEWGEANVDWLRSFLEWPNGIPSHDTFGNVFAGWTPVLRQNHVRPVFSIISSSCSPLIAVM
jgi:DDE_Tnp_1-associated